MRCRRASSTRPNAERSTMAPSGAPVPRQNGIWVDFGCGQSVVRPNLFRITDQVVVIVHSSSNVLADRPGSTVRAPNGWVEARSARFLACSCCRVDKCGSASRVEACRDGRFETCLCHAPVLGDAEPAWLSCLLRRHHASLRTKASAGGRLFLGRRLRRVGRRPWRPGRTRSRGSC